MLGIKLKSASTSLPDAQVVHGIKIIKQPVGQYAKIMERMGGAVLELLEAGFPGQKPGEILTALTKLTTDDFRALVLRLMTSLPDKLLDIISAILGAEKSTVEALSPAELVRVWKKFWEVNDLTYFFTNAREIALKALPRKSMTDTGSKA